MFGKEFLQSLNNMEKALKDSKKEQKTTTITKSLMYIVLKYNSPKTV